MTFDAESDRYKTRRELESSGIKMNPTLEAAVRYAALGLSVFPVNGKVPITPHGFKDATCDTTQMHLWWDVAPEVEPHGIAIATGNQFAIAVLDIDPRNGGDDSLEQLARDGLVLPDTPMVLTGGGGRHYYFSIPRGIPFAGRSAIRAGIDLKADGGYVVAPPSVHASGKSYVFDLAADLDVPLSPMPNALLAIINEVRSSKTGDVAKPGPKTLADAYPEGTRHGFLLSALGTMRRKNFSREAVLAAIREENRVKCKPPFTDAELVGLVGDIFKRWQAEEDVKIKKENRGLIPDDGLTDLGNAKRFVEKFNAELRWSKDEKKWYGYTGIRWQRDALCAAQRAAQTIPADLRSEAEKCLKDAAVAARESRHEDADALKVKGSALAAWAKKSEGSGHIAAILTLAAPLMEIAISVFDSHWYYWNFRNGTVDLRTCEIVPHDPAHYITNVIDYNFDYQAISPLFDSWIVQIMAQNTNLADFVISCFGYTATGSCKEQVLFCCYGPTGANGKSVLFDLMASVFGDYWTKAPPRMLEESQNERHPTMLAGMFGKRLVTSIETGIGKKMDENLVKELTGGDKRSCRRMYEDFWAYSPTDKWWVGSNHRLKLSLDPAVVRRIVEIPFDVHFHDPEKGETGPDHLRMDKGMLDKLKTELPGIALRIAFAAKDWIEHGLKIPGEVLASVADYKADMDAIGEWMQERTIKVNTMSLFSEVYRDFMLWCERTKSGRLSSTAFSIQMQQKGFAKIRDSKGRRSFSGIALRGEPYQTEQEPARDDTEGMV